jgi:hypothetical protein
VLSRPLRPWAGRLTNGLLLSDVVSRESMAPARELSLMHAPHLSQVR